MKQFLNVALVLGVCLLASSAAQAQGPGVGGPKVPAATNAPLDGGASLLLAAGIGIGLKKLRTRRQF